MAFAFKGKPEPPPELPVTVREVEAGESWIVPRGGPGVVAVICYGGIDVATIHEDGSIAPVTDLDLVDQDRLPSYGIHVTAHGSIGIRNYKDRLLK